MCFGGQCGDVRYNSVMREGALSQTENASLILIIYWLLTIPSALYVLIHLSHIIAL